jgi:hypothetical protein
MRKRRCEILLPIRFNDGRPVSGELLEQTREELMARFGAVLTFIVSHRHFLPKRAFHNQYTQQWRVLHVQPTITWSRPST